jgi:hypothetical protein
MAWGTASLIQCVAVAALPTPGLLFVDGADSFIPCMYMMGLLGREDVLACIWGWLQHAIFAAHMADPLPSWLRWCR